jgi:hypothetical protein
MKRLTLLLLLLLVPFTAAAQNLTTSGSISVQAAACSTGASSGYVWYQLPKNTAAVALALSGTWTGTVQFVGSADGVNWASIGAVPIAGGATVTSATGNATWSIASGGVQYVCAYASTYTTGPIAVSMSSSTSGSGGSSYNPASVAITGGTITGTSVAGYLPLAGGTLTGTLLFSVDNTYNIGAAGATRPAHVYVGTDLTSSSVYGGSAAGSTITLQGTSNGSPASAYLLLNPNGQRVGIGTVAPGYTLDVSSNDQTVANLYSSTGTARFRLGSYAGAVQVVLSGSTASLLAETSGGSVGLDTNSGHKLTCLDTGKCGVGTSTPHSPWAAVGLPTYANNAAAITGGLAAGDFYRTGADPDPVMVVH